MCTTLTAIATAVLAFAGPQGQGQAPSGPRAELERLAAALDAAVRQVSLPSADPLLGGEPARGYYVTGVGAVFMVPPRSIPRPNRVRIRLPGQPALQLTGSAGEIDYADLEELLGAAGARRFAEQQHRQAAARRAAAGGGPPPSERELQALEERAALLQREAEAARREFELLAEQLLRHMHVRLGGAPPQLATNTTEPPFPDARPEGETAVMRAATVPGTPVDEAAPGTPGPPPARTGPTPRPLPPPWSMWPEAQDPRAPERIVADVRNAVTDALELHGPELRSLAPDELISVAVDFVPRGLFSAAPRPARTLVIRVPKQALDERAAGRLDAQAFRRQVQISEY